MVAEDSRAQVQALFKNQFTTEALVLRGAARFGQKLKAKPLVTKKCQAWFYLRLVAYGYIRLSEGHTVIVGAAATTALNRLN